MERKDLKLLIRERGFTYQQLADEIGVSVSAIAEIVAGRTEGRTARYALAKALGCDVADIWPDLVA
jgi:transcriptional regulator with XRE-family HTH domain